jgi:5-methyltetrahydropteroyltriglutamate--homocysteine methyltransferase
MESTSLRTRPPFRADHVGSLLRPPRLHQARDDFATGRITAADLRTVEDEEIIKAVRMQEEVGLQSATDGEFRRATWHMDFIYALGGVSKAPGHLAVKFTNPSGTIEWTPAALHVGRRAPAPALHQPDQLRWIRSACPASAASRPRWRATR